MGMRQSEGWRGLAALVLILAANAASSSDAPAETKFPLSIPGVADGPIKVSSRTAGLSAPIMIESQADDPVDAVIRVSQLRDSQGTQHDVRILAAEPRDTSSLQGPVEQPVRFAARGSATLWLAALLPAQGEYTGEVILIAGNSRQAVKLTVARSPLDLGVEILGVEPANDGARAWGESTATLRLTLSEKMGRRVDLLKPTLIEYARKEGNARTRADFALADAHAKPVRLNPGEAQDLSLQLTGFDGAGEYVGKLRFSAPGMNPADAPFTVILRQPAWLAFVAILIGVLLSTLLRWLGRGVRPRLVERRRLYKLMLDLDTLTRAPGREPQELELLQSLRAQGATLLDDSLRDDIAGVRTRIDVLESLRKVSADWISWRRRVLALSPPELRDRFQTTIDQVRDLLASASKAEDVTAAVDKLKTLRADIDAALKEILQTRIAAMKQDLEQLNSRPDSDLAGRARTDVRPLLAEAEAARATDLQRALRTYMKARNVWAKLLVDDLSGLISSELPVAIDAAEKDRLLQPLAADAAAARELLATDVDAGIRQYQSVIARYNAALCKLLPPEIEKIQHAVDKEVKGGRKSPELDAAPTLLQEALAAIEQARTANVEGKHHEALGKLWIAMPKAQKARAATAGGTRGTAQDLLETMRAVFAPGGEIPGPIGDPGASGTAVPTARGAVSRQVISMIDRLSSAIDLFSTVVAIVVASALGITTLWAPDATWGGWQDWLVAVLWGLGLHQFTFAGVSSLRDRLVGIEAAGTTP